MLVHNIQSLKCITVNIPYLIKGKGQGSSEVKDYDSDIQFYMHINSVVSANHMS